MRQAILPFALLACSATCLAQSAVGTPVKSAWTVTFENDVFFHSDDNYTDGVQYEWVTRDVLTRGAQLPIVDLLCKPFVDCSTKGVIVTRSKVGQLMYTPTNIAIAGPQPGTHPWGAMAYFQRSYEVASREDRSITFTALIGAIGPRAYAEPTQKWIHKHITNSPQPKGWDNQISGALGLLAMAEDRRESGSMRFSSCGNGCGANSAWYWRAAVGNVMTYVGVGATLSIGKNLARLPKADPGGIEIKKLEPDQLLLITDDALPARRADGVDARPDTSCLAFDWLQCTLFGNLEMRAVVFNVFLDGNLGRDDPSVKRRPLVADVAVGFRLDFPRSRSEHHGPLFVQLKLTQRTPEFRSAIPVGSQKWGALSVGTQF